MIVKKDCEGKTDEELVALSLVDSSNFYCLMTRYEGRLTAYVHNLTYLPDEDIADVLQNAFIKTYQHLNEYDSGLKFSSWIYRIVHNEAINLLKKTRAKFKLAIDDQDEEIVEWLTDGSDIEKDIADRNFKECVKKMIDNLRLEYKEVLTLRFLEDKDYQEISDILQKPMGTVATLLSRAKKQFKEAYEKNKECQ